MLVCAEGFSGAAVSLCTVGPAQELGLEAQRPVFYAALGLDFGTSDCAVTSRGAIRTVKGAKVRCNSATTVRPLALAYGAAGFSGSGSIGNKGVLVKQMRREACKQFPERVVLVHDFRTSRVSSAHTNVVAGQAESFSSTMYRRSARKVLAGTYNPTALQYSFNIFTLSFLPKVHSCITLSGANEHRRVSEFCKAATLLIVTVPGSVEEERSFSAMNFIKDERRNSLSANLSSTLRVYLDKTFTLKTFLYKEAIDYWMAGASARGRYLGHRV
ncbi:hypothetical protein QJQ45_006455 [Haematococcus lacustris]|nr:hypothetical protein QJQ45_006455 [Haematococcus lacustris]